MIKIYGKNCLTEALRSKAKLNNIYLSKEFINKNKKMVERLDLDNVQYQIVTKEKLDSLFGPNHQGIGAIREDYSLYDENIIDEIVGPKKRILILDGIADPHNLGAILRSVDAFGFDAVILPKNRSCFITETVAHVSTGAIEHVKISYVNSLQTVVKRLKDKGYWICGTDASGDTLLTQIDPDLDLALIIGSEGFGMSKTLVNLSDYLITIPMVGHVNSLNASVSAGILLEKLIKTL